MAYNTSTNYKKLIYDEDSEQIIDIIINGNLIDRSYIRTFTLSDEIFESDSFSLGSAITSKITLELNNEVFNDVGTSFDAMTFIFKIITGTGTESVPMGRYIIKEKDESSSDYTKYTLYDYMDKFDVEFDASNIVPCTRFELLQAICDYCDVDLANTSILNGDAIVGVYDNSITAKTYLSLISERAGGFAKINRSNQLVIKTLSDVDTIELPTSKIGDYTTNDLKTITKIVYENAAQKFEAGTDDGVTVYLSQDSPFSCTQEEVNNIFNKLNGLQYQTLDIRVWGDPAIDTGDILTFDGIKSFAQKEWTFGNGFYGSYKTILSDSTSSLEVVKIPSKSNRKKLESRLNEAEGKITLLSEEVTENTEKVANMEITVNSISESVSSIENLIRTVEGKNKISITDAVEGHLLGFSVKGNISLLFPSKRLFPSKTLFGKNNNLIIEHEDGTITTIKLPFKHLWQYGEIYDEFLIDSQGARLIQRIGKNEDGNFYVLDEEIITTYENIEINLKSGNSFIYLQSFQKSNVTLYAKYCGKSDITDTFALKTEVQAGIDIAKNEVELYAEQLVESETDTDSLTAKINLKPGKIALEGTVTANGNLTITTEGDLYGRNSHFENGYFQGKIEADSGSFKGHVEADSGSFKGHVEADSGSFKGNVYLGDGSIVVGGNGMLTTRMIDANIKSQQFLGGNVLLPMGFSYTGAGCVKDCLEFAFEIPEDFTILNAYIILDHVPVSYSNAGTSVTTGYSRDLKLYKSSSKLSTKISVDNGYAVFGYDSAGFSEVPNAFGSSGFTGSSSSGTSQKSIDIISYIDKGFNLLKIESDASTPSNYSDCYAMSGACKATLYINGYTKFS